MTAQPATKAVYVYRGDPWSMSFASTVGGVPEPVVAADALAQFRASVDDTDVLASLTVAVSGDDDEIVTLSLTPEETAELPVGTHKWDFQPDPDAETWLKGDVTVEGDVSRPVAP